ncbi:glycoside hydrolase family 78 protein [Paenibacillus alkaliterrae]|uniref:glycoside hydrolase family 78 protein n=1 Tax=Paenibacillus alkaliterrae TaxID=320909 RepID=UPI001F46C3F6|nr:glycoside hydrolase family 78 protein [Paenibacillus alkaliterrae]MCF2939527.1 glycoside hydrolase family 78 protein [Paenibacillus alkaliterrae]
MFKITELRCEYQTNPIGIGVTKPRISWKLQSDERAVRQTAYQIVVAGDAAFANIGWDSGRVETDQSVHVELDRFTAESCTRYYYRVRAWNQAGEGSAWSDAAYWEMGLLAPEEWAGSWIAAPLALLPVTAEPSPMLRKGFELKGTVKEARLYATALGLYELELNGQRVGDSYFTPGWTSYSHSIQTQTYEVTGLLKAGGNAIGAVLGNGWYKGNLTWSDKSCLYGDRLALLLQLRVEYEDGQIELIVSDHSWKAATGPILMSEIYHGETYDARLEREGWSSAAYDDKDWSAVEILEHSKSMLKPQVNESVRKQERLQPLTLITTPKGETVLDFGQNLVGWVRFSVQGHAGMSVELRHAEVLDREGNFYTANLRSAKQLITYVLKGGERETFEPHFTFQGFRYVQLTGFPEAVALEDFTAVVLHSDMEETGTFECSDPLVNQLQHNIKWGLKGNFLDVPTDCPQRDERLGWTGDAQMFIQTASYLSNVAPFFTKWLRDVEADQAEDGGVPFVVPQVLGEKEMSSAAWGDAAVICPWTLYVCYGDKRILAEQYDSMKAWVSYIRRQGENEFLWNTGFHFGDWLGLDAKSGDYRGATENDFIATAFYALSVSLVQKAAKVLGKEEDAAELLELHGNIAAAFREEFVTASGRLAMPTQTAHVLALMFGLLEEKAEKRAAAKLAELLEKNGFHLTTGFVGTPYLNHVLSAHGLNAAAYKMLLQQTYPSWLYPVTKGATTIWEHWDGIKEDGSFWSEDMNSFNHYAYGAIGDWMYRTVAGIQTVETAPGYKQIIIAPKPGDGLTWAEGRLETMYGTVSSKWRISENGACRLDVTIPPNTSAEVHLPSASAESKITESGTALSEADGITAVADSVTGITIKAGSGSYRFAW